MLLTAIAAVSSNFVIGRGGDLPWHIPEDLQRFKAFTRKKWLVMGRNTWVSIGETPLPGRPTIVVSRRLDDDKVENATVVSSLKDAIAFASEAGAAELVVVGGAALYKEALPLLDMLSLTRVHAHVDDGDVFFPTFFGDGFALRSAENFESNDFHCTYQEWTRAP
ncbi:MAG: dihydrofolate reductase [Deltaproteobacteria bacterium]|nr:dihydrofolate reductase [Deltaproteobacteria bacterium]